MVPSINTGFGNGMNELMVFLGLQDFMTNELKHWKYLKEIDVMVIHLCPKPLQTPYWEHTMEHVGVLAYMGLFVTLQIWHTKNV